MNETSAPTRAQAARVTETIVLLHGIGSRYGAWQPVEKTLGPEVRTIGLDLPGFNGAPLGDVTPTVDGFADAIEHWLAEQDLGPVAIAGFSLGGAVALELGRRGRATRVVAFAPIGFWRRPGAWWCRTVVIGVHRASPVARMVMPVLVRWRWSRRLSLGVFYGRPADVPPSEALMDFDAFRNAHILPVTARAMAEHRFDPKMPPGLPVTIAWGTRDRLLPARSQARRARQRLPQARHVLLDGCGHVPFHDDPHGCRVALSATSRTAPTTEAGRGHVRRPAERTRP